jgi:hypothetical protein
MHCLLNIVGNSEDHVSSQKCVLGHCSGSENVYYSSFFKVKAEMDPDIKMLDHENDTSIAGFKISTMDPGSLTKTDVILRIAQIALFATRM